MEHTNAIKAELEREREAREESHGLIEQLEQRLQEQHWAQE